MTFTLWPRHGAREATSLLQLPENLLLVPTPRPASRNSDLDRRPGRAATVLRHQKGAPAARTANTFTGNQQDIACLPISCRHDCGGCVGAMSHRHIRTPSETADGADHEAPYASSLPQLKEVVSDGGPARWLELNGARGTSPRNVARRVEPSTRQQPPTIAPFHDNDVRAAADGPPRRRNHQARGGARCWTCPASPARRLRGARRCLGDGGDAVALQGRHPPRRPGPHLRRRRQLGQ